MSNIPELRFSEFHENYKNCLFENIFLFSTGKNIKQNEASPEFETPCVRYGELYHLYDEVITQVVNKTNLDKAELIFSEGNEILLPSAGEDPLDIGSASALVLEKIAIGRTINVLRPKEEKVYSQIYVSYYINQKLRKVISTLARGASISNVYNSDLKKLKINLPTLPEQQKIATFLSAVDKKLGHLRRKHALLESYKRGIMQKIFSPFDSAQGKPLRFKQDASTSSAQARSKVAEPVEAFPDWEEKRLGDVVSINPKPESLPEEFVYIDLESVKKGHFYPSSKILLKDAPSRAQRLLNNGDVLFQMVRPYQRNNLFFDKQGNYVASTGYAQLRAKSSLFIFQLIHTDNFVNKVLARCTGTSYPAINSNDLGKISVVIPSSEEEQQKIANFLSTLDKKLGTVQKQIDHTEVFKKGLLQKMFV